MWIYRFISRNYIYLLWFVFYFNLSCLLFGGHIFTFIVFAVVYIISISIALSPLGEKLLRFLENVRSLETKREKEYLIPIFKEVYNRVRTTEIRVEKIEICIIDAMYINAFALGKKTVAVTTGALRALTEEELKGLIAHEIGHIVLGHTIAVLLSTIGNGIFVLFVLVSKMIINAIEILHSKYNKRGGVIEVIIFLIKTIFDTAFFLLVYIGQLMLSINSRENEYAADRFAYKLGYGTELVEALYLIQDMLISDKMSLFDKLKRSHPNIAKRIGRLECRIDKKEKLFEYTK